MSEQKIFSIKIDGVEQGINNMQKLQDVLGETAVGFTQMEVTTKALKQAEQERASTLNQIAKLQSASSGSIKEMAAQLSLLRKQYDSLSKSERENVDVGGKLLKNIQDLDKEYKAAKESTGRFQDSVGNYEKAVNGVVLANNDFGQQLTNLKNQMQTLISAGIEPTTEAYQKLKAEYLQVFEAQKQFDEQMQNLGSRTTALDNIASLGTTMAASFGAVNSVMAIFGKENTKVEEALKKSAAAFTLVNQVQTIQKNLMNSSTIESKAFNKIMDLLCLNEKKYQLEKKKSNAEITKGTTALKMDSVAKKADAAATNTLTVAEKSATVAAKGLKAAIASTGVGLLLVGLGELVNLLSKVPGWIANANSNAKQFKATIEGIKLNNLDISAVLEVQQNKISEQKSQYEKYLSEIENFYSRQLKAAGKNKAAQIAIEKEKNEAIRLANKAFYRELSKEEEKEVANFNKKVSSQIYGIQTIGIEYKKLASTVDKAEKGYTKAASSIWNEYKLLWDNLGSSAKKDIQNIKELENAIKEAVEDTSEINIIKALNRINVALADDNSKLNDNAKNYLNSIKSLFEGIQLANDNYKKARQAKDDIDNEFSNNENQFISNQADINQKWRELRDTRTKDEIAYIEKIKGINNEAVKAILDRQQAEANAIKKSLTDGSMNQDLKVSVTGRITNPDDTDKAVLSVKVSLEERLKLFEEYAKKTKAIEQTRHDLEVQSLENNLEKEKVALKDSYEQGIVTKQQYNDRLVELDTQYGITIGAVIEQQNQQIVDLDKRLVEERKGVLNDYLNYASNAYKEKIDVISNSFVTFQEQINLYSERKVNIWGKWDLREEKARLLNLKEAYKDFRKAQEQKGEFEIASLLAQKKALEQVRDTYKEGTKEYAEYNTQVIAIDNKVASAQTQQIATLNDLDKKIGQVTENINQSTEDWAASWAAEISAAVNIITDAVSTVFDYISARQEASIAEIERELESINQEYEAVTAQYETSVSKIEELQDMLNDADATRSLQLEQQIEDEIKNRNKLAAEEKRLAKEKAKLEKEQNKAEYEQKVTQLTGSRFQAIANTAAGIAQNLGAYPWPYSLIPVGIVTAMGVLQQMTISEQIRAVKASYAGKFAEGGEIKGRSHAEGGVQLEAEGGEYIINKRSTAENYALIDYINKQNHAVTLSEISDVVGKKMDFQAQHKTVFATGGGVPSVGTGNNINAILKKLDKINFSPVVSVVEINEAQQRLARVQELAGA